MGIGQVIGSTTLRAFKFVIKEGEEEKAKRDEFVTVEEAVRVAGCFAAQGIMVHAYLMYGFPTQTVQDTVTQEP